ncbi:MAG: GH92 family glycosyl hydrolase [Bacteroidota bacterium]|nr:GH92 family glycosyl hydrolase [Bacteroidota bacterium]
MSFKQPFNYLAGCLLLIGAAACSNPHITEVDPFIGTGFHGHTFPGATTPNGLVQLSPDTRTEDWDACSGYHYSDNAILGFSHTHLSGTGCADLGDFLFTPAVGDVHEVDGKYVIKPLPFSHENEKALPGYYSVSFPERGVAVELSATARTGAHRYHFSGEGKRHILIDLIHGMGEPEIHKVDFGQISEDEISGIKVQSWWVPNRGVYFNAKFSEPIENIETTDYPQVLLTFSEKVKDLDVFVGISMTDEVQARENRIKETEGKSFSKIVAESALAWENKLKVIEVEGGSEDLRKIFYTSLYHTMITPNLISDCDADPFYSTLSLWDVFRTWAPLQNLINPELISGMIDSMLESYDRNGILPVWPLAHGETWCMIGYHSIPVIADAWLCGIRTFDGNKALDAMVSSSDQDETSPGYNQYGYVPSDLYSQSVSETLEMAYDDWCIARMAEDLGRKDVAEKYYERSKRYVNLFDPATRFFRGKDSKGNWVEPFNPLVKTHDFTEAVPWQFRFFVPHDFKNFETLMGGREQTLAALDSLFTYEALELTDDIVDMTGLIGEYAHGNEPSHNMAYLFAYLDEPAKTQHYVRRILSELYTATPEGISGNEDCGQMSAWYVMSALGFYPACPGSCEFVLTSPIFSKTTIKLGNGKVLTVTADHPECEYISEVSFNGKLLNSSFITYNELLQGGTLEFKLSDKPASK